MEQAPSLEAFTGVALAEVTEASARLQVGESSVAALAGTDPIAAQATIEMPIIRRADFMISLHHPAMNTQQA
jgi:hypothetical protein